jgi:hypothetical protein
MDGEDNSQKNHGVYSPKNRVVLKFLLGIVVALTLVVGGLGWLLLNQPTPQASLRTSLEQLQSSVGFPLYYPTTLPENFVLQPPTAKKDSATITFTMTYDKDKTAVVIQQARPPLMEEVTKTQEFTTRAGQAYIANLNGKRAGFLVTDKSLVMLTSQFDLATEDVEDLLRALAVL